MHLINYKKTYTGSNLMDQFQHKTSDAEFPHKPKKEYQCAQKDAYSLHINDSSSYTSTEHFLIKLSSSVSSQLLDDSLLSDECYPLILTKI
jgi:hypothetical protein